MVHKRFCHSRTPRGQKLRQFCRRYGIAPRVRYDVASRKILIPLSRELYCLIKGEGGGEGGKGHGRKCSPPSVSGLLVFPLFFFSFFRSLNFEFPAIIRKRGGEDPPDPLPSVTGIGHYGDRVENSTQCAHVSHHSLVQKTHLTGIQL
jgi:hypothetical protein